MRRKDLRLRSLNQHVCQHAHTHTHTHLHTLTWHYWEMVFHVFDQVSNRKDHVLSAALHWCASGELNHGKGGYLRGLSRLFHYIKREGQQVHRISSRNDPSSPPKTSWVCCQHIGYNPVGPYELALRTSILNVWHWVLSKNTVWMGTCLEGQIIEGHIIEVQQQDSFDNQFLPHFWLIFLLGPKGWTAMPGWRPL